MATVDKSPLPDCPDAFDGPLATAYDEIVRICDRIAALRGTEKEEELSKDIPAVCRNSKLLLYSDTFPFSELSDDQCDAAKALETVFDCLVDALDPEKFDTDLSVLAQEVRKVTILRRDEMSRLLF